MNNKDKTKIHNSIKIISQNFQRVRLNNIDIGEYLQKCDVYYAKRRHYQKTRLSLTKYYKT